MTRPVTLRRALGDPRLLGDALPGDSWFCWRSLLIAARGEPLDEVEALALREVIGDRALPAAPVREVAVIAGRRSGKDVAAACLAVYLATLVDHSAVLRPGEIGTVLCLGADQSQARVTMGYARGVLESSPLLAGTVENVTADTITLTNGIEIVIRAANFRRLRGLTCVAVIASEVAFWIDSDTSANPADEILAAVRPSLLTTRGPLVIISSPYSRSGPLFETWAEHFGKPDPDVLVAHAKTRILNPTIPQSEIDRALARDPILARSEFLAEWRDDVSQFVSRDVVEACVDVSVCERPQHAYIKRYHAFVDPSGGSADSFTMAIAHREGDRVVLDALREVRAPFSPDGVVDELCRDLDRYRVTTVTGDRYAGEWPREAFRKRGIRYECSELDASALYREMLPRLNTRTLALLDHPPAIGQIAALERRVGRTGKDQISHPRGAHDDLANVIAGVSWIAGDISRRRGDVGWASIVGGQVIRQNDIERNPLRERGAYTPSKRSKFLNY
jgi:hypothetical protein